MVAGVVQEDGGEEGEGCRGIKGGMGTPGCYTTTGMHVYWSLPICPLRSTGKTFGMGTFIATTVFMSYIIC